MKYTLQAEVWLYPGKGGWHFLTLPKKESAEIKERFAGLKRPWGAISVLVTIGKTTWRTSLAPDKKTNTYSFPIKADIRTKENITVGDTVKFQIEL